MPIQPSLPHVHALSLSPHHSLPPTPLPLSHSPSLSSTSPFLVSVDQDHSRDDVFHTVNAPLTWCFSLRCSYSCSCILFDAQGIN